MDSNSVNQDNAKKQGIFYGWIAVTIAFIITAITSGVFYSYGVFLMPLLIEFGWTRGLISGAASISAITYAATIPLAGLLCNIQQRRLTVTARMLNIA